MVQELSKRAAEIHSGISRCLRGQYALRHKRWAQKDWLGCSPDEPHAAGRPNSKTERMRSERAEDLGGRQKDQKLTQLLFCDLSTPKNDGNFSVYDDIRKKLISAGVPENEIEFIHNADTEAKKAALFSKSALRRCASFARKHCKNGSGHQRPVPACGSASFGCWLEAQRHDPAQWSHHPAGQYE